MLSEKNTHEIRGEIANRALIRDYIYRALGRQRSIYSLDLVLSEKKIHMKLEEELQRGHYLNSALVIFVYLLAYPISYLYPYILSTHSKYRLLLVRH